MEEIEYEECKQLFDLLHEVLIDDHRLYHSTTIMLQYLKEHPAMREVFLRRNTDRNGLSGLTWEHLNKTLGCMTSSANPTEQQAYLILSFIVFRIREILHKWFEPDMDNEEEFAITLSRFIRGGMNGFLK